MRWLEHRRHSRRDAGADHLSPHGIRLAREIGRGRGPFLEVVTSPLPRAVETAAAMGFPPSRVDPRLSIMGPEIDRELGPIVHWSDFALSVRRSSVAARFARAQEEILRTIVERLPEGSQALVISHGGIVELGAACALPRRRWSTSGAPASYCEGVRLAFDGERWTGAELLRVRD